MTPYAWFKKRCPKQLCAGAGNALGQNHYQLSGISLQNPFLLLVSLNTQVLNQLEERASSAEALMIEIAGIHAGRKEVGVSITVGDHPQSETG
jgi:hypothetical protein